MGKLAECRGRSAADRTDHIAMRRVILIAALLAVAGCNLDAPRAQAACKADDPACFRR